MRTYECKLVNEHGCTFDRDEFTSKKATMEWARGRGANYRLMIYDSDVQDYVTIKEWKYSKAQ